MSAASGPLVCGPSSPELKANVANFMTRAEQISNHPLAGQNATFSMELSFDRHTGEVTAADFDMKTRPDNDWLSMAVWMRPIIFVEQDSVSIPKLTSQIEREHVPLRGLLKSARTGLTAWKRHVFIYAGVVGEAGLPGEVQVRRVSIGPAGVSPSGVPLDGLATDYEYADTYLNANVWHADADKSLRYQQAGELMQQHYRKCAELRVLSAAKEIILPLRQWILDARARGHDL